MLAARLSFSQGFPLSSYIRLALDAMGGDHGPKSVIPGAALALEARPDLRFTFFGDAKDIQPYLNEYPALMAASDVVHTDVAIASDDKPAAALRRGRQSSMRLAIDAAAEGRADCVVSAGNTGALMATAKLVFKCLQGIHRPAIASVLPSAKGRTVMLDLGANVQCDAENLVQFSILGACFARSVLKIERPTVGLLNIGSEDMKGHETLHEAAAVLQSAAFPGHFFGFVEGNDITAGTVDVVVTDGFTGNIALKTAEGVGRFITQVLKDELGASWLSKLGYALAAKAFKQAKKRFDHRVYNGGLFLGLNGICIKSHGSADAFAFSRAVLVAADMVTYGFNDLVAEQIEKLGIEPDFVSMPVPAVAEG